MGFIYLDVPGVIASHVFPACMLRTLCDACAMFLIDSNELYDNIERISRSSAHFLYSLEPWAAVHDSEHSRLVSNTFDFLSAVDSFTPAHHLICDSLVEQVRQTSRNS